MSGVSARLPLRRLTYDRHQTPPGQTLGRAAKKRSYEVLRDESSPVKALEISGGGNTLKATVRTRGRLPAHTLTGYRLRWVVYAAQGYPVEQHEADLPTMAPGTATTVGLGIEQPLPARVQVDVVRPTGFSARSATWTA